MNCVECHNPHDRAIHAKNNCAECHADTAASFVKSRHGMQGTRCVECHMPKASKSAISVARYTGDVRTHIFKINTDPKASMFKEIEDKGKKSTIALKFVTVEYACLSCHASRDKDWAAANAKGFHKAK